MRDSAIRHKSTAYANQFGFAPHKGYKKAARAWGGVKADDQLELRELIFSFVILLMNLYHEDEEAVERHYKSLVDNEVIPESAVGFLRLLRDSEMMQENLEDLVHPSPGLTVRPISSEVIDQKNGHCLLICIEHFCPEDTFDAY